MDKRYKNICIKSFVKKGIIIVLVTTMTVKTLHFNFIENIINVYGDTTTEDLNAAQDKKNDINVQIQNTQEEIAKLQQQSSDTKAYIAQLDSKMNELDISLYNLNNDITLKQEEIDNAEAGLAQAIVDSEEQYASMKLRIKFMYERSTENYLQILFSASNMGDMLNRAEYISKISEYDREMLEKYQETVDYIAQTKAQLESDYVQLDNMATSLESEKGSLSVVQEAKNAELMALNEQTDTAMEKESSLHADLAAQESEIEAMEAQIAAQEEARRQAELEAQRRAEEEQSRAEEARRQAEEAAKATKSQLVDNSAIGNSGNASLDDSTTSSTSATASTSATSSSNTSSNSSSNSSSSSSSNSQQTSSSGFVWPTVSRRITSDYGDTEDRSSGHQGIDIGATTPGVSGDAIYAAASGTVTLATYSSSAGNWIWIYHGNGLYTVYMHCSALLVSVGDTVSQGQTIARMGSTGNSTGAHLHFGVRLNGSYVNPWNYFG